MSFKIVFKCFDYVTDDMVETLRQLEHPFEIDAPHPEIIEISLGSKRFNVAGKQSAPGITIYDEQDALLFKLKFFDKVYEVSRQETF